MSDLGNKQIMAENIQYYMRKTGVTSKQMCEILGVPASTFSYWLNAKTYPRIDKIEKMAAFFGVKKSDLVEEHVLNKISLDFFSDQSPEAKQLRAEHKLLTELYDRLPPEARKFVLAQLQGAVQAQEDPDSPK